METAAANEGITLAREAADQVGPFLGQLESRYRNIVKGLHAGADAGALTELAIVADDLEHFLKFLVLVSDYVEAVDTPSANALTHYQRKLFSVIEGIEPALADSDLVEVADAIEDDLLPTLREYGRLDASIKRALAG